VGPSLDTTIFIGNGVWLFAKHPEEWQKVRESPSEFPQPSTRLCGWKHPFNPSPVC